MTHPQASRRARLTAIFRAPLRPGTRLIVAAGAAGGAVAAGQAPVGAWPITLVALAIVTALVARASRPAHRIWLAWTAGCGYFAATLFWIVEPFMVDAARDGWMAPFALVFMAGGMALFWAFAGLVASRAPTPAIAALAFALGLAGGDLLRSYVLTGFPWALMGHVWIGTPVMQAAAWVGPVGLSVLTCLVAALPIAARGRRLQAMSVLAVLSVLSALWVGGRARLDQPLPARPRPIMVRLVQPNATQGEKWRPEMWDLFLRRQFDLSTAPATRPLDLVVWPETAIPWLLDNSTDILARVTAASGGTPLALGVQRAEGERYYNSLAVTDADGRVAQVYDKWHLVPFGEYVPLGDMLAKVGIAAFAAQAGGGYSAGPGPRVLDLGRAGRALPLICYEAIFPQDLRTGVRADWILQVTNDGWFGNLSGPYQHLAQARLRAVEQGLPLLRAANTGVTAVIDARGHVLQSLPLNTVGRLDAEVPPATPTPTLYARTGDWPVTVLIAAAVLLLAIWARRNPVDRPR